MDSFALQMNDIAMHGMLAGAIAMGVKCNLFQALDDVSSPDKPATHIQVADKAGCKPRYVKEWLAAMACGNIVEVTPDEKFYMVPEKRSVLVSNHISMSYALFLPHILKGFDPLAECFKKDGPLGLDYDIFGGFYEVMAGVSDSVHTENLITGFVPLLGDDLVNKLRTGGLECLDVGCGNGLHSVLLADEFPNNHWYGIDLVDTAINEANERRNAKGEVYKNITFLQMDAGYLDKTWTNKFDFITIFDACHDQQRPDLCLNEIYRVLKPGGVFGMLEVCGSSNIHTDKKENGLMASALYATSMFHCLPVGSNSKEALCVGNMWGREVAKKLLKAAGFNDVSVVKTPQFVINQLFIARK